MRRLALALCLLVASPALADTPPPPADRSTILDLYMKRAQPAYGWTLKSEADLGDGLALVKLELTSQTWRTMQWRHRLNVLVPPAAQGERARAGHAILAITGTGGEDEHVQILSGLALRLGVPVAILHDVPNQPLYAEETTNGKGLREDALIAKTFEEFAKTGDADWPLLLPMTRSAVAALDALGELSAKNVAAKHPAWKHGTLEKFVVCGASKRGWTTWLTACVEPARVVGIAPIVYDNLNIPAQLKRHLEVWGAPSKSIHDYTDRGLMQMLNTDRGRELLSIVDPYTYRDRLALPKLALMGTNDTYWPVDAVHLYRGALPGELHCHYVPNAGHSAGLSIVDALSGFFDHVTKRTAPLPPVSITVTPRATAVVSVEGAPARARVRAVRVWCSRVEGKDFTKAKWEKIEAAAFGDGWSGQLPQAFKDTGGPGSAAFIGEVELPDSSGRPFLLHTPVSLWELGAKN